MRSICLHKTGLSDLSFVLSIFVAVFLFGLFRRMKVYGTRSRERR